MGGKIISPLKYEYLLSGLSLSIASSARVFFLLPPLVNFNLSW